MQTRYEKQRRSSLRLRLLTYDYTQIGGYFVTIVTKERSCLFGEIINDEMRLSPVGSIVRTAWNELPDHFSRIKMDGFIIMPNHVHGIIQITETVGAQHAAPLQRTRKI